MAARSNSRALAVLLLAVAFAAAAWAGPAFIAPPATRMPPAAAGAAAVAPLLLSQPALAAGPSGTEIVGDIVLGGAVWVFLLALYGSQQGK
eukprot:CAMPEP_0168492968 /NCGR_PEP_ID=MMETSP0228-20121227/70486_1 /TAXON_ID=133427 /ORGANISM="Protoceratium reticulatum, Strain CCCM 535 (=CCMP 1889)" /LENGTH=90 /DNA_ID=CAMNT_0008509755 /DNA_START=64 /DNA_END=336 /DNA_ORIENTATION=-